MTMRTESKSLLYNRYNTEHVQVMGYLYARPDLHEKILEGLPDELCYLMSGEYHEFDAVACMLSGEILTSGAKRYRFSISDLLDIQHFDLSLINAEGPPHKD